MSAAEGPGPTARRVLVQARYDLVTALRNGEQLLVTVVLPVGALVALGTTPVLRALYPHDASLATAPGRLAAAVPGVLALAVLSSAFTSQAIATGFDRRAGALRLLGTTPLGRPGLVAARVLSVLGVQVLQFAAVAGTAYALGWRLGAAAVPLLVPAAALGTAAFCAWGLLLAGTLRAEAVLALANLLWVVLAGAGGVLLPAAGAAAPLVRLLPSAALGDLLRAACLHGSLDVHASVVLAVWTVLGTAGAVSRFSWD